SFLVLDQQEESTSSWPFASTSSSKKGPLSDHGWSFVLIEAQSLHAHCKLATAHCSVATARSNLGRPIATLQRVIPSLR
ncbi:MAG TPA: hypothetical protein VGM86_14200, partial [Thermoanaerobaculia bacterium]